MTMLLFSALSAPEARAQTSEQCSKAMGEKAPSMQGRAPSSSNGMECFPECSVRDEQKIDRSSGRPSINNQCLLDQLSANQSCPDGACFRQPPVDEQDYKGVTSGYSLRGPEWCKSNPNINGRCKDGVCINGPIVNGEHQGTPHNGTDISAPAGASVYPVADGIVVSSIPGDPAYTSGGKSCVLIVKHQIGGGTPQNSSAEKNCNVYYSAYLHLSATLVSTGAKVTTKTPIGKVGNCGTTAVHLHYELRDGYGNVMNPLCNAAQGLCGGNLPANATTNNPANQICKVEDYQPLFKHDGYKGNSYSSGGSIGSPVVIGGGRGGGSGAGYGGAAAGSAANYGVSATGECSIETAREGFFNGKCAFCPLFAPIFNVASAVADQAFKTFAQAIQAVMLVGFALWIGIKVMGYMASFETKEPRMLVKELLNQAFVVLACFLLLRMESREFLNLMIMPLIDAGLDLGLVASGSNNPDAATCPALADIQKMLENPGETGGLPVRMGTKIMCVIYSIQQRISDTLAMGSYSICLGTKEYAWHHFWFFPHLGFLLIGLVLWVGAFLLMVIYPFLLIDSLLQLCVAVAFLPVVIACYAFKITRSYTQKIFDIVMNAALTFTFLSLVISMLVAYLEVNVQKPIMEMADGNTYRIIDQLAITGNLFLQVAFLLLMSWAVLEEAKDYAKQFASGLDMGGLGEKLGGTAASGANAAQKYGRKKAWAGTKALARGGKAVRQKLRMASAQKRHDKLDKAGMLNNKNQVAFKPFLGKARTMTFEVDGTGKVIGYSTVKKGLNGKTIETRQTKGLTQTITTDKHGNKTSSMKNRTMGAHRMTNADGSNNSLALGRLLAQGEAGQSMAMEQMLKEKMPNMAHLLNQPYVNADGAKIYTSQDEKGRTVYKRQMQKADGSMAVLSMVDSGNGRMMMEATTVSRDGRGTTHQTDGIYNRQSSYRTAPKSTIGTLEEMSRTKDENGKETAPAIAAESVKTKWGVAKYYKERSTADSIRTPDKESYWSRDEIDNVIRKDINYHGLDSGTDFG